MDFDSAIRRIESSRPSQDFSLKIKWLGAAVLFSKAIFMLRHVANNFQAISTVAKVCRRLHATWMQHEELRIEHSRKAHKRFTRTQSFMMHELAHVELKHVPARVEVSKTGLLLLSDYSDEQEQEADWHAGAFLLPRDGLVRLRGRGKSSDEIATFYGVSKALCEWHLRMTGVDVQMRRAAAR